MKAKIVLAAIVAMMLVAVMPVAAVNVTDTVAVVTGSGTPPVIEEKFELNDDGDPLHTKPGTQVIPVPDATKEVCAYVVAWDPNGAADINRVWVTVDDPNGVEVANGDTLSGEIVELLDAEMIAATQAAFDQGLIDNARRLEINNHTANDEWRMWKFCFDLSHCDPSGNYTVDARANDGLGGTGALVNTFEYLSIKELAIDFTTIDYGEILAGVKQIVSGDGNFGTADAPTIRNRANDPFKLRIYSTDMVGTDPNNVIAANHLDSRVYGVDAGGSAVSQELYLGTWGRLFDIPIIDTCITEPIDFSLRQNLICSDTYTGTITLEAVAP
jgi:hypothetical protein